MSNIVKTKIRVGRISYINCLPYYHGLLNQAEDSFEYLEGVPSKINAAMHTGKIDIAPVSSLEYLNNQDKYLLLPHIGVGARDFSGSVLLLSKCRVEELNREKIAVTDHSLSSAILLKILMRYKYNYQNEFVAQPSNSVEMLKKAKAALIIGDDALFHSSEEFLYKYDLGELWWSWMEKPFCFAVWVVRREFAKNNHDEVLAFQTRLRENLLKNLLDLEKLLRDALEIELWDQRFSKIFGYLFNLNYNIDANMVDGMQTYYEYAHRLGVSPQMKSLEYFGKGVEVST